MEKMALPNAHPLKIINGILLLLFFFVFRILLGIGYSVVVSQDIYSRISGMTDWSDQHFAYYNLFAMGSLSVLNVYWFFLLFSLMMAKITALFGRKNKKNKKDA
jgi:hypothetical protein